MSRTTTWVEHARAHRDRVGRLPLDADDFIGMIEGQPEWAKEHLWKALLRRRDRRDRNLRTLPMASS